MSQILWYVPENVDSSGNVTVSKNSLPPESFLYAGLYKPKQIKTSVTEMKKKGPHYFSIEIQARGFYTCPPPCDW